MKSKENLKNPKFYIEATDLIEDIEYMSSMTASVDERRAFKKVVTHILNTKWKEVLEDEI